MLAACDVYRPAAIKQLQVNGEKQLALRCFSMGDKEKPGDDCRSVQSSMQKANGFNVVILDTAGRLHVDEAMMEELQDIKEAVACRSDNAGSRCHDRSGCGKCGIRCFRKRSVLTVSS